MLLSFAGHLYCEDCYGKYLAPDCEKCRKKILGVSLNVKMQVIFEPRIMDSQFTFFMSKFHFKHKMGIMFNKDGVKTKQEYLCCKNMP